MYESKRRYHGDLSLPFVPYFSDSDLPTSSPPRTIVYQYETLASPSRTFYENSTEQSAYIPFESIPAATTKETSPTPPFQRKLPSIPVATLGFFEILGGLAVLILEVLVFDIAVGLWCGCIYALAGIAAIVLGQLRSSFRSLVLLCLLSDRD
jgi:hypothetical protein